MRTLTAWVLARHVNALVGISGFAVLGLVFPPLIIISLALLGLVTLRQGGQRGALVIVGSLLFVAALAMVVGQGVWADLTAFIVLWGAAWLLAVVYRQVAMMNWMIIGAGILGLMSVAGFYMLLQDPAEFWLELLNVHLRPIFNEAQVVQSEAEMDKLIQGLSRVMTGGMSGLFSVVLVVSLLLARWWQARLFNPGGFRKEFHALRLGRPAAIVMLALIATSLLGKFQLATDMATVVWLLFFFQGLAVVHSLISQVSMSLGWLVSIYMLLALMPYYASPVISGLGFVDTWFDFRRRIVKKLNKSE